MLVRAGVHGRDGGALCGVGVEGRAGVEGLAAGVEGRGGNSTSIASSASVSCTPRPPENEFRLASRPSSGMHGGSLSSLGSSGTGAGGVVSFGRSSRLPHDEVRWCFELRRFRRNMLIVSGWGEQQSKGSYGLICVVDLDRGECFGDLAVWVTCARSRYWGVRCVGVSPQTQSELRVENRVERKELAMKLKTA